VKPAGIKYLKKTSFFYFNTIFLNIFPGFKKLLRSSEIFLLLVVLYPLFKRVWGLEVGANGNMGSMRRLSGKDHFYRTKWKFTN